MKKIERYYIICVIALVIAFGLLVLMSYLLKWDMFAYLTNSRMLAVYGVVFIVLVAIGLIVWRNSPNE